MLLWATFDQDSVIVRVKILDSTVATGAGKTGLVFNSAGLIVSTMADSEATATAYTTAGSTIETITTLGTYAAPTATKCRFKEVDATNHKGVYELQFANARFAIASAKSLLISISGVTGAAECDAVIPLPTVDLFTAITYPANFSSLTISGAGLVTADLSTTVMTESYAADGATISAPQALYMIKQMLQEMAISGTTMTVKKIDGTTTAMTFTLNDAVNPTSITRAT